MLQNWTPQATQVFAPLLVVFRMVAGGHTQLLFTMMKVVSTHWHADWPFTTVGTRLLTQVVHMFVVWQNWQLVTVQFTQVPETKLVLVGHTQLLFVMMYVSSGQAQVGLPELAAATTKLFTQLVQ